MMIFRWNALHAELIVTELLTPALICGCLLGRVCVALRQGMCGAEDVQLSYDTEHAAAETISSCVA